MSHSDTSQPLPASAGSSLEYRMLSERRSPEAKAIRRASMAQGRDYSPRRGKVLVPRSDGLVQALQTSLTMDHYVLATPKSINQQLKPTRSISTMKTTATSQPSTPTTSPSSAYSLEDFHVRLSALQASGLDLRTPEAHSSLTLLGFAKTKDPDIWYSKMSRVYLVMTGEKLSRQSLGFSPTLGMTLSGSYLIQRISASRKTGSASTLSDILEVNVDPKYYLSPQQLGRLSISTE